MTRFIKKVFSYSLLFSIFFSYFSFAEANTSFVQILKSDEDFIYDNYYQINEDQNLNYFKLLDFTHYKVKFPMPSIPYSRQTHFGGWLRDNSVGKCLNTRGKVLIRDSATEVSLTPSGCTVVSGLWNDPYTARAHDLTKDIEIDHLVALKNAYMTGAHEWDFKKRCLYANYLGNGFHLLSVNAFENRSKSDHSPSGYTPPNKAFTCEFIKAWLNIKLIWSLRVTPKEASAIEKIVSENNCNPQNFTVSAEELNTQRNFMSDNANLCTSAAVILEKF